MKPVEINALTDDIIKTYQACDGKFTKDYYNRQGKYSESTIRKNFKSWNNMLKELDLPIVLNQRVLKDDYIDDITYIYGKKSPSIKFTENYYDKHGKYTSGVANRLFGSWSAMIEELGLEFNIVYCDDRQDILDDMVKVRTEQGYLTSTIYRKVGKYKVHHFAVHFGSFTKALAELGLNSESEQKTRLKMRIKEKLIALYNKNGFVNTSMIVGSGISYNSIIESYGSLNQALLECKLVNNKYPRHQTSFLVIGMVAGLLQEDPLIEYQLKDLKPDIKYNLRIDAYFPKKKIALEYDGIQHFESRYDKSDKEIKDRKKFDKYKDQVLKSLSIRTIRISYKDNITLEHLKKQIEIMSLNLTC